MKFSCNTIILYTISTAVLFFQQMDMIPCGGFITWGCYFGKYNALNKIYVYIFDVYYLHP